jgi:hypothetical protein
MLPDNELSTRPVTAPFLVPYRLDKLVDYEWGGVDLADTSQGLQVKIWTCKYVDNQIIINDGLISHTVLNVENVTALSFSFDLSMRPIVTYLANEHCYLWWYDTAVSKQITSNLGTGITFPQLALDEHREVKSSNADVIFSYIKNNKAYMLLQRERFLVEHEITAAKRLVQIGMMTNQRFGFALYNWN